MSWEDNFKWPDICSSIVPKKNKKRGTERQMFIEINMAEIFEEIRCDNFQNMAKIINQA